MKLSIVVGNPKPQSRTRALAHAVAERIAHAAGAADRPHVVDLADHGADLFTWPHEGLARVAEAVAASDVVVVASPTFKGSYTGLLKAFLDRYDTDALAGVVAVPVMTGNAPNHALAVDVALRTVLVELGASVPSRGLYFVMTQVDERDAVVDAWAENNVARIVGGKHHV